MRVRIIFVSCLATIIWNEVMRFAVKRITLFLLYRADGGEDFRPQRRSR